MSAETNIQLPPIELLNLLADGELHSGQELANVLGVSRTAVWKQLGKLETIGLELESKPGRGYCLNDGLELLDVQSISRLLTAPSSEHLSELDILTIIDSTNA